VDGNCAISQTDKFVKIEYFLHNKHKKQRTTASASLYLASQQMCYLVMTVY